MGPALPACKICPAGVLSSLQASAPWDLWPLTAQGWARGRDPILGPRRRGEVGEGNQEKPRVMNDFKVKALEIKKKKKTVCVCPGNWLMDRLNLGVTGADTQGSMFP